MKTNFVLLAALLWFVAPGPSLAQDATVQVLSPTPPGEHTCVAVPIGLAPGERLTGLRWLNNDASLNFPKILLLEGEPGVAPDLTETGLILYQAHAGDLQWGQLDLPVPVTSSTDFIYAVFVFPAQVPTTALGGGGGPGIGIVPEPGEHRFYLSADGLQWVPFGRRAHLAVEALKQSGYAKGAREAVLLRDLKDGIHYDPSDGGASEAPTRIERTRLYAAQPNPFNPRTQIRFDLAASGRVRLVVYNVRGQRVQVLLDGVRPAGRYRVTWEGKDDRGRAVASGVYFVRLVTADEQLSTRMVLVR